MSFSFVQEKHKHVYRTCPFQNGINTRKITCHAKKGERGVDGGVVGSL